jgi:lipopolysaccharide export system protein LptC
MSELAEVEQRKKQVWAAPGGFHDSLMTALKIGLPILIGVLLAYLALAPLTRTQEISFILDKNKVEVASERLKVQAAEYRGQDDKGRPFKLTARNARQVSSRDPLVQIAGVKADIMLDDGPGAFVANRGTYNLDNQQVNAIGPVLVTAPDNYRLLTSNVAVDLNSRQLQSQGNVKGTMSLGNFEANQMHANIDSRVVTLEGGARLHIVQGAIK